MNDTVRINGGVAVITGAASGIGAGLARHASLLGIKLVLADQSADALNKVASEISTDVIAVPTDVSDDEAVDALAVTAFSEFGSVDLLFNNAGILTSGLSWDIEKAIWQRAMDVNIGGVVNAIRSFVPRMIAADRPARIINTASVGGFYPSPLMAPYSATKFAVVAITEALAGELAQFGSKVSVSLLAPGPVKTDLMRDEAPAQSSKFMQSLRAMADRKGLTPDQFAPLVFAGIERGDYWIIPQPESLDDRLRQRTEMILNRENPFAPDLHKGKTT
ncbi:SDR family NAD(P)-dependent oxidoreductase [Parasphingorhabdus halotolerans]|uniref:SDR family NAD(P)-dependent oxidoreductase n=1 Tax=Parasphingorhabdus halotolerans TaxID=2725558 RepID=A0A6H2DKW9_9SPHN|nr:SDR family NAD(P)-dependent oxidoreductase [Parasphingorhabdus halotolerans]QJB68787.1 SDR family NAD(P)-dependent oxidoreductase [Parasphingorhabdus halotolerans]